MKGHGSLSSIIATNCLTACLILSCFWSVTEFHSDVKCRTSPMANIWTNKREICGVYVDDASLLFLWKYIFFSPLSLTVSKVKPWVIRNFSLVQQSYRAITIKEQKAPLKPLNSSSSIAGFSSGGMIWSKFSHNSILSVWGSTVTLNLHDAIFASSTLLE